METYTIKLLRKPGRFEDPRIATVHLDCPVVELSCPWPKSDWRTNENRVMPLRDEALFAKLLRRKSRYFVCWDSWHTFTSGYYCLTFRVSSPSQRRLLRKLIADTVQDAGGFYDLDSWLKRREEELAKINWGMGLGTKDPAYL